MLNTNIYTINGKINLPYKFCFIYISFLTFTIDTQDFEYDPSISNCTVNSSTEFHSFSEKSIVDSQFLQSLKMNNSALTNKYGIQASSLSHRLVQTVKPSISSSPDLPPFTCLHNSKNNSNSFSSFVHKNSLKTGSQDHQAKTILNITNENKHSLSVMTKI